MGLTRMFGRGWSIKISPIGYRPEDPRLDVSVSAKSCQSNPVFALKIRVKTMYHSHHGF
jgi:hypothetical protein